MFTTKPFTARQKQILDLYITGITYRDIARELGLSPHTIRRHIEQIYKRVTLPHNDKYNLRKACENTGA